MTELASPRQRVWFRLRQGLHRRAGAYSAAGLLMREKPEDTALLSLSLYPPGEGAEGTDPRVETFMWELLYVVDEASGRDWDWGHEVNGQLANKMRTALSDGAPELT